MFFMELGKRTGVGDIRTDRRCFSRQNFLSHSQTFFFVAKLSFSRQKFLSHGKTFFIKKISITKLFTLEGQQQQHSNWCEKMENGRDMAEVICYYVAGNPNALQSKIMPNSAVSKIIWGPSSIPPTVPLTASISKSGIVLRRPIRLIFLFLSFI